MTHIVLFRQAFMEKNNEFFYKVFTLPPHLELHSHNPTPALLVLLDHATDEDVRNEHEVQERFVGHWRSGMGRKPRLDGFALVRVPVRRDHGVVEDFLRNGTLKELGPHACAVIERLWLTRANRFHLGLS